MKCVKSYILCCTTETLARTRVKLLELGEESQIKRSQSNLREGKQRDEVGNARLKAAAYTQTVSPCSCRIDEPLRVYRVHSPFALCTAETTVLILVTRYHYLLIFQIRLACRDLHLVTLDPANRIRFLLQMKLQELQDVTRHKFQDAKRKK